MFKPHEHLSFKELDRLSVECFVGSDLPDETHSVSELGPYCEWMWLRRAGHTLGQLDYAPWLSRLRQGLRSGVTSWRNDHQRNQGFIRVRRDQGDIDDASWISFCRDFDIGAQASGIARQRAKQLTGAVMELEDNVHEHSGRPMTGLIAYRARTGLFEFVVLDVGIGVLESLRRCADYHELSDHGEALAIATSDGNSRYGKASGHGFGFRDLILGIANANSELRFRSGDHLLKLDGRSERPEAQLAQRANGDGLLIAVSCAGL